MFPSNHLLVLSQSDFLQRQLGAILTEAGPAPLPAHRRIWRWATHLI